MKRKVRPYSDPYFVGIGIGVVLLSAYVIAGRGLGASGAFASVAAALSAVVYGSTAAAASPAIAPYLTNGIGGALHDWLFYRHGWQGGLGWRSNVGPPSEQSNES
jgi:uncharacterized protein